MKQLEVDSLTFAYASAPEKKVLCGIGFSLEKGAFLTVCGSTGSGKTTLLRCLKRELAPNGEISGRVLFCGSPLEELPARRSAAAIGFVMQDPEHQLVTDKVWHELAFGPESLGMPADEMRRRIAETAAYFGMEGLFDRSVDELSGGEKQLLALASVLVTEPEILILDEPTARLDPVAAASLLDIVGRLNRETGLTVIISEHHMEQVLAMSSHLLVLDGGRCAGFGPVRDVIGELSSDAEFMQTLTAGARLWNKFKGTSGADDASKKAREGGMDEMPESKDLCPLSVTESAAWLKARFAQVPASPASDPEAPTPDPASPASEPKASTPEPALELKNVRFRYERSGPDVLCGVSLSALPGCILSVLGGNGSGKTTLLSCAAGLQKPYFGEIRLFGKKLSSYSRVGLYQGMLAMLPQDVQTLFMHDSVRRELSGAEDILPELPFDLTPFMDVHPYDLSGGWQQLMALAKVLAARPRVLLLDEPTKGLDAVMRAKVAGVLRELRSRGLAIVIVTHDVEFAAQVSDNCVLLFRGETVSEGTPAEFFGNNRFYTTETVRIARGIFPGCVTYEELEAACRY